MLISDNDWKEFYTKYLSDTDVIEFSRNKRISPAIVAGRIQKERNDYRVFRNFLGQNKVKKLFMGESAE